MQIGSGPVATRLIGARPQRVPFSMARTVIPPAVAGGGPPLR
jgi:hypothetical protein